MDITRYETHPVNMFETPAYKVPTGYKNEPDVVFTEDQMQAAYQSYCLLTATLRDLKFADVILLTQERNNRVLTGRLSPMNSFHSIYAKYNEELRRSRGESVGYYKYHEANVTLFNFHTQQALIEGLPVKKFPFLTPLLEQAGVLRRISEPGGENVYTVEDFCSILAVLKQSLEEELSLHGVACSPYAVNTLLTLKVANCRSLLVRGGESGISSGSEQYPCGGLTPLDSFPIWFELITAEIKAENILLLTSHMMNPKYARTKKLAMTPEEIAEIDGIPIEWVVKMVQG